MSALSISTIPDYAGGARSSDAELLRLLRDGEPKTVDDLKQELGVTATAVRQRIERLLASGLIDREKVVVGRGRPNFRYTLTLDGYRFAGSDAGEFAEAMWREIMLLRDSPIRRRLISAIARRLGKMYAGRLDGAKAGSGHSAGADDSATAGVAMLQRMRSLSDLLIRNHISAAVHVDGAATSRLPVLDICACPYPTLRDTPSDRSLCKMEEEMLSEALGAPVQLTSCRLDGEQSCQFTPIIEPRQV